MNGFSIDIVKLWQTAKFTPNLMVTIGESDSLFHVTGQSQQSYLFQTEYWLIKNEHVL